MYFNALFYTEFEGILMDYFHEKCVSWILLCLHIDFWFCKLLAIMALLWQFFMGIRFDGGNFFWENEFSVFIVRFLKAFLGQSETNKFAIIVWLKFAWIWVLKLKLFHSLARPQSYLILLLENIKLEKVFLEI